MSRGALIAIGIGIATAVGVGEAGVTREAGRRTMSSPAFDVEVTGTGRPILLIPGLSTTGDVWDGTVEHLEGSHQLHVLTLAGFGGPAPIGEPFLSRVTESLIEYVRAGKLDRPVLVGHSLGGFLAFAAASKAPGLFGGIVAVDGVPFMPALGNPAATAGEQQAQAAQIKAMYATFTPEQLATQSRLALAGMITDPADVERAAGWAARADAATVGLAVAEMLTTDLRPAVRKIEAPVLLIGALGAAPDAMWPAFRSAYEAQVEGVPNAMVVFAERARHFVMLDDAEFLFETLDRFLAAHPVPTDGLMAAEEGTWTR